MSTTLAAAKLPAPAADGSRPAGGSLPTWLSDDRFLGWLAPLLIAAVAGVLRFWRLGHPHSFVFDETYYAKDAWSLLQRGNERGFVEGANERILQGDLDVFTADAAFVAHPPAGKWVIALGEQFFGLTPFGWRFMVALLGTVSVLMLARIARRLFDSTLLGCIAGFLLAVDGQHFVHSRTALLDLILMFFALAAFGCLLADRDWFRRRLTRGSGGAGDLGRWVLWRPWLLLTGVFLGLACGTKWSGVPFVAVFGLFAVAWNYSARRGAGARWPLLGMLVKDGPLAFLSVVGVALVTYVATWSGWLLTSTGWNRQPAEDAASSIPGVAVLRMLWRYHLEMWKFNSNLSADHPYSSHPPSWLILGRPVSFHYQSPEAGTPGCPKGNCSEAILAIGTPVLWWAGVVALVVAVYFWLLNRDWRAGAICAGYLAAYVPWYAYWDRTIYAFYTVAVAPWVVLAVTYCLGLLLGPRNAPPDRRTWGAVVVGTFVLLVLMNFAFFYPVLAAQVIPYSSWSLRMWFPSWI